MLKREKKYTYFEAGEGTPIIVLHGLMGGLSNFGSLADFFPTKGYKVVIPELPLYTQNILKTNVKAFSKYVKDFIVSKGFDQVILVGNSLGGHIALYFTKMYPELVKGLGYYWKFRLIRKWHGRKLSKTWRLRIHQKEK
jgi:pimeloyl-ACP methyl ester carboxylesterase